MTRALSKAPALRPMSKAAATRACAVISRRGAFDVPGYVLRVEWPPGVVPAVAGLFYTRQSFAYYQDAIEAQRKLREILTTIPCVAASPRAALL